jgi:CPA2 family monovalent cation:H+ antiporter-2
MLLLADAAAVSRFGLDLLILLGAAGVLAVVFRRFKLELIPGYLIAGIIVGPRATGLIGGDAATVEAMKEISELATVLLLFSIGLDLDIGHIRRGMVHILAIGTISTLVFTIFMWMVLMAFKVAPPAALVMAMALAMSSTAVLVRILMNRRETRAPVGRVTLGVAIVQDMLSVVVMALIPPIALWAGVLPSQSDDASGMAGWLRIVSAAGIGIGGVASMLVMGRYLLPRVLHIVARTGSSELVLVAAGAVALGAAVTTGVLGFSPQMGAFLAGFMLAATPFRYQLAGQIAPMRDLLMAVFFTSVGLQVAPAEVLHDWWIVGLGVVFVMAAKIAVTGGTSWAAGMTASAALVSGVYLANAGEFSLVILGAAGPGAAKILDAHNVSASIAVVTATLFISPMLVRPAHRWSELLVNVRPAKWIRTPALREAEAASAPSISAGEDEKTKAARLCHVIIAGFGPVGRTLADRFDVLKIPFTVIELNPKTVERQAVIGRPITYGDVTNPEVLESAGIRSADAIILTIPDDESTLRAVRAIRAAAPDVFIAARTSFLSGKFLAHQLGADLVTVEELATAQAMEKEVLAKLGQWKLEHDAKSNGQATALNAGTTPSDGASRARS